MKKRTLTKKLILITLCSTMLACPAMTAGAITAYAATDTTVSSETPPTPPDGETPPDKPDGDNGETPPDKPDGDNGNNNGNNTSVSYNGANTISSDTTTSGSTYSSTTAEQNALLVSGGTSTVTNATVTKSGSPSGQSDNYDFYGTNAAVLVYNGATLNLKGGTVTTDASYANGVFACGTGVVTLDGTTINTSSNNSGAVMVTNGGTLTANNVTATTQGNSAAPIRSDRGGGTLTVNGGTYTSNGTGSPAIYCTADITVNDAKLTATKSEGIVIEDKNSVTLNNTTRTDTNSTLNGQSTTYKNIFLYQSMSGDASVGTSSFKATDSKITTNKGDTFYITNTSAVIELSGNTFVNNDSTGAFLRAEAAAWGTSGSNGGDVTLKLTKQTAKGDIVIDSISTLDMSLSGSSSYTGAINSANTAKSISLTLDSSSKLTLTGDSYVTSLTNADSTNSNINLNGYKLYVNGTAITASSSTTALENNSTVSSETISKGDTVTVNAKANGGTGSYTYAVLYKKASSEKWTTVQSYKSNSTIKLTPAAATTYDVCIKAKDSSGKISKKYMTIKVNNSALTNSSTLSASSIKKGSTVTVNAKASGGTGSYTYAVCYKKSTSEKWTIAQTYKSNSTIKIKPAVSTTYDVCIKVKDSSGTIKKIYKTVTVK